MAFDANGADGTAYDSQYPRHAFVFIENSTQSGISIFLVWPVSKSNVGYNQILKFFGSNFETAKTTIK